MLGRIAHNHHELLEAMGVGRLNELKLTLQPPESYEGDEDPIYWGTKGAIRAFLAEAEFAARDRYQPYSSYSWMRNREARVYTLTTEGLVKIGKVLEKMGGNLYAMLQALGFYPDVTDTSKKPHNGQKGVFSCRREEGSVPSSSRVPWSKSGSLASAARR